MFTRKTLIAHKAQAELEHTFTRPNFPTINQLEALMQYANEQGDTEAAVHFLEAYRNQLPPKPTEGLMLQGNAYAARGDYEPHRLIGRRYHSKRLSRHNAKLNSTAKLLAGSSYC